MHLTDVPCKICSLTLPFAATRCDQCGNLDVVYPNIRYADDPAEVRALEKRVGLAREAAEKTGSSDRLSAFQDSVASSNAVLGIKVGALYGIVNRENQTIVSYYKSVRGAGSRIPENNKWDMTRESNDARVSPHYFPELNFAALSLTDDGVGWYGGCNIVLKEEMIRIRTSVFEENPFNFLKRFPPQPDEMTPPGYRACWDRRSELAVAKLHDKINPETDDEEFPNILLERDTERGDTDFIEVHIHGPLAPAAFARVSAQVPVDDEEEILAWQSLKLRLEKLGIEVKEMSHP